MTITFPVPAWKLRAGDVIRADGRDETVEYVSGINLGSVAVRTDAAERVAPAWQDMTALVPTGRPADRVGLYKADGGGLFHCTCVYRVVETGLPSESVTEDPKCPSHGSDRDDDWD